MAKLLKIFFQIIGSIIEWLLIILIFVVFAVRSSAFQTYLAEKATNYYSDELKTTIQIDKVDIFFFNRAALDGILILDQQKDTLASIGSVSVSLRSLNSLNFNKKILDIKEARIEKGTVKLYRAKKDGEFNFQFIADYFASEDTTTSEPFLINLNKISISQLNFKFDDYRAPFSPFGMDYSHLDIRNLYLRSNLKILKSGGIESFVKHLSLRDKSGVEIDRFSSKISFDEKGLQMKYFRVYTPLSKIYFSKLNLLTEDPGDFSNFVDRVVFDVELKESLISLQDVSYFATVMEGMDQKIILEAEISKRIKDLKLANLDLKTGDRTRITGNVNLPDFRELDKAFFDEKLSYVHIDLKDIEKIKMPKSSPDPYLTFDPMVSKFEHVTIRDLRLNGFYSQFVLKSDLITSKLGSLELDNGILFTEHKNRSSFTFERSLDSDYDIKIDTFQLGRLLSNNTLGDLSGSFFLNGEIFSSGKIDFNNIDGELTHLGLMSYSYKQIEIAKASFRNNVFEGKISIKDDHIGLEYDGFLDLNKQQHFNFTVDIVQAELDKLNLTTVDTNTVSSSFKVDISGTNLNNYSGKIELHSLRYREGSKDFEVPSMTLQMQRSLTEDELSLTSNVADLYIKGKIDVATIASDINNQLNKVLPAIFVAQKVNKKSSGNHFDYRINLKQVDELLAIFSPGLSIANGTTIKGKFDNARNQFDLDLTSNRINYNGIIISNLNINQVINEAVLDASYSVGSLHLSDSIDVNQVTFKAKGSRDEIDSEIKWNPNSSEESYLSWKTIVNGFNSYYFNINPSYFTVRDHRWEIANNSQILLAPNDIQVQNFKMQRENQYLMIDGCISEQNEDILKLDIKDLELGDFSNILTLSTDIKGTLNGTATVSNPFKDVSFTGNVQVKDLFLNGSEVGDINVKAGWGKSSESIDLSGELFYKKNKTFSFAGNYFLYRKENLNFDLKFDYTDLQFTNAFMDPQVLSGIRGLVDGGVKITGSTDKPTIQGDIGLMGGNAKVEMFGVNFGFDGRIKIEQDGIFIDNMPIIDEDGNSGMLVATVFHNNFQNWNFDISFNLIDDAFSRGNTLNRFLVMNTRYKEGDIYYGKAYVTGTANIFGYADNMQISVDLETRKGSQINFPMYGMSELTEDQFITFVSRDTTNLKLPKIDYSGINLGLNFKVTPDAQLKIIFDENLGDEITAYGQGNIAINLDNIGDLTMNGVFEITKGSVYNFAMGPIKQPFFIEEGGTISWTGDPVNAILDLKTYNVVRTSLSDIMPTIEEDAVYPVQDVKCYLNLSQTLLEPLITFDIQVPKANENDKAALNRIKGDKDELNKQFFSLLLVKKFQPVNGNLSAGAGAGLDLVSSQLNDMLNKVSSDVKFNVALANSKDAKSAELGLQKNLLGDRLILKGSLGVENTSGGTSGKPSSSSLIGDVNIEYLINEKGTFRVSIFNESNDNTVIQEKTQGQFTQGAGLNYQEEFNNVNDFQLVQYFLDLFRQPGQKRYPIKRKRKQKEIPASMLESPAAKPED